MKNSIKIKTIISLIAIIITSSIVLISCKKDKCKVTESGTCGGSNPSKPIVDLVVLIDGSGSMFSSANVISGEVQQALNAAQQECNTDLRVTYLSLESPWIGTNFISDQRAYLTGLYGSGISLAADRPYVGYGQEQGANGVEDIAKYFDWRAGACRAIFYISDEELDGIFPLNDVANEIAETNSAISAANSNNVAVSAHYIKFQNRAAFNDTNYLALTTNTNGQLFTSPSYPTAGYYTQNKVFNKIVCNACTNCD